MISRFKLAAAAASVALSIGAAGPAKADIIQLGFILDSSGSIGTTNWNTIRTGLANAINSFIPVGGPDQYEISVVTFSSTASTIVNHVLVTDAASRTSVANAVAAAPFIGTNTNFAAGFSTMQAALMDSPNYNVNLAQYVNFATDGVQNLGGTGVTERNNLIAAGVNNISIEGIGSGVDAADLQNNFCSPQPCDTTSPFNFPTQGFYVTVANAAAYADAISHKIIVVTGGVPEPATMALIGVALFGVGFSRRRKLH